MQFTSDEVITNLSSYHKRDTERDLLKLGLSYTIPPKLLNKSDNDKNDIFTIFERLNQHLCTELRSTEYRETLREELSQLVSSYYNKYKPSSQTLKQHCNLKKLKGKKVLVITRPDKGNGVAIINRK